MMTTEPSDEEQERERKGKEKGRGQVSRYPDQETGLQQPGARADLSNRSRALSGSGKEGEGYIKG